MIVSMTGFAAGRGAAQGQVWTWDLRGVNGKGLDLRLRLPEGIDGLDAAVRSALQAAVRRGNVTLSLRLAREAGEGAEPLRLNPEGLAAALAALATVERVALDAGVTLAQASQGDVLGLRGVLESGAAALPDTEALRRALLADLPDLLAGFNRMRAAEGAALAQVIGGQLNRIAALVADAGGRAAERGAVAAQSLRAQVAALLDGGSGVDESRLAQELALLAVKSDVTEELDRLSAHVAAARALLAEGGAVGRKFDFLMQEFMREANTLCSKAQSLALTRVGLDLKTVIDQMREQVQNVE